MTVVRVTVKEWPNRRVAILFLEQRGWKRYDGPGTHESPDGAYWAYGSTSRRADEPEPFATITFFEHADDAEHPAPVITDDSGSN